MAQTTKQQSPPSIRWPDLSDIKSFDDVIDTFKALQYEMDHQFRDLREDATKIFETEIPRIDTELDEIDIDTAIDAVIDFDVPLVKINISMDDDPVTIVWASGTIKFGGETYTIAAGSAETPTNQGVLEWAEKATTLSYDKTPNAKTDTWIIAFWDGNQLNRAVSSTILHGGLIQANTITADQIDVGDLFAEDIKVTNMIHSSAKTTYADTDQGWWMGIDDDKAKFNIGDANEFFKWDGTNVEIRGALQTGSITVGSSTVPGQITLAVAAGEGDTYIASGKTDFVNTGTSGFILGIDDDDEDKVKFYIGNETSYLNWDGEDLTVKGAFTASSITLGDGVTNGMITLSHVDGKGDSGMRGGTVEKFGELNATDEKSGFIFGIDDLDDKTKLEFGNKTKKIEMVDGEITMTGEFVETDNIASGAVNAIVDVADTQGTINGGLWFVHGSLATDTLDTATDYRLSISGHTRNAAGGKREIHAGIFFPDLDNLITVTTSKTVTWANTSPGNRLTVVGDDIVSDVNMHVINGTEALLFYLDNVLNPPTHPLFIITAEDRRADAALSGSDTEIKIDKNTISVAFGVGPPPMVYTIKRCAYKIKAQTITETPKESYCSFSSIDWTTIPYANASHGYFIFRDETATNGQLQGFVTATAEIWNIKK